MVAMILACGEANRVADLTGRLIPKHLLSIGPRTIIAQQLRNYASAGVRSVTIVVPDAADAQLTWQSILATDHTIDLPQVKFCFAPKGVGTMKTLLSEHVSYLLRRGDTLIQWSDIILSQADIKQFNQLSSNDCDAAIGIDPCLGHRCNAVSVRGIVTKINLQATYLGNMPGVYWLAKSSIGKLQTIDKSVDDIAEALQIMLQESRIIRDYPSGMRLLTKTVQPTDYGDKGKFIANVGKQSGSGWTSFIDLPNGRKRKTATTAKGVSLLQKEANFYQTLPSKLRQFWPNYNIVTNGDNEVIGIDLEWLDQNRGWQSAQSWLDKAAEQSFDAFVDRCELVYTAVWERLVCPSMAQSNTYAETVDSLYQSDFWQEYFATPVKRHLQFKPILEAHRHHGEIVSCNGLLVGDTDDVQARLGQYLQSYWQEHPAIAKTRAVLHGDSNTDNVLIQVEHGKIVNAVWIDPRGYFGSSKWIDPSYDMAKLIYGMSGYGQLNSAADYQISLDTATGELTFSPGPSKNLFESLMTICSLHKAILAAIIWYKVPQYWSYQPAKAIVAHYWGQALLNWLLPPLEPDSLTAKQLRSKANLSMKLATKPSIFVAPEQ